MIFDVLTLFKDAYAGLNVGIIADALEKKLFSLNLHNVRDYTADKHNHCDDSPYGGGAGMIMSVQPIVDCICAVDPEHTAIRIAMSPRGVTLNHELCVSLSKNERLLFLAGNYEGIDQRAIDSCIDMEISLGDYVLTSGDLPIMVTINAIARHINGVLGSSDSLNEESFTSGLLEYPQYTRPAVYNDMAVPDVLLSGNHAEIAKWRMEKQLEVTEKFRFDLYEKYIAEHPPIPKKQKKPKRSQQ